MVHVCSHLRQRHNVVTVMTFASVSMIVPLQNGQAVWRGTVPVNGESGMVFTPLFQARCWRLCAGSAVQE